MKYEAGLEGAVPITPVHSELLEVLSCHGFTEDEIEDLARVSGEESRKSYGDLAWIVDQMVAEAILRRHGYENAEQILQALRTA